MSRIIPQYNNTVVSDISKRNTSLNVKPSTDDRTIKMYHCIFGQPDDYGTVPIRGCFAKSINERGPSSSANGKIPVLWQHKLSEPLAIPTVLIEDEIGLYSEFTPDEGVEVCDRAVIQARSGTVNNGSYGFNYIWDKLEYDEKNDLILMKEVELIEISIVTIGSQRETFVKRSFFGDEKDVELANEVNRFIKSLEPKKQMQARSLFERYSLLSTRAGDSTLNDDMPKSKLDYDYILKNIKL